MATNSFDLRPLRAAIRPAKLLWFPRLRSTNSCALKLRHDGKLVAPSVVLTGHQIAGRGRGGNTWWSGEGSIAVTFALAVDAQVPPNHLPLLVGLAMRNAASRISGVDSIQLKWPNDLLASGRKLAGILCERVDGIDLIGVGLNVNVPRAAPPPHLRNRVTSLSQLAGRTFSLTDVLIEMFRELNHTLHRRKSESATLLLREYDQHHALIGRQVSVVEPGSDLPVSGTCEGIDSTGRLLLRSRSHLHRITAGHVSLMQ